MRIIDCLERHATASPDKLFATQSDGTSVTYGAFMADVRRRAGVLSDEHRPHTARVLRTSQTISYLADYFACHLADVVAVPVEHDLPAEKLAEIERMVADVTFPDEAADVLFTTGTTGAPKGVVLSHKALMADAENLAQTLGFHANLTFIIHGPLNHFGSHSKVLPVVLTGGSLYVMEGMKRLDDFYCAIDHIEGHV
ncbi:MAG: AMP-binding protein, partial [Bacteroidales bacterium]|nr:AMP-binding protein [Bacteroidales bacterium]